MIEFRENDFKYVMQDIGHIYIGARMTYEEVGEHHDTPSKVKSAIYRCIMDETDLETTIGEHLFRIQHKSKSYYVYQQLAVKIKMAFLEKKLDKKGMEREEYVIKTYSIDDFVSENFLVDCPYEYFVQEISFSKRKLMSLAV